jgi:hypothetical protein
MFTKRLLLLVAAISFALVGIGIVAGSAGAGSLMITDVNGAKWKATWDPSLDKVLFFEKGDPTKGDGIGTLIKTAHFMKGVTSMEILFTQTSVSPNPDKEPFTDDRPNGTAQNDFGLRFTLDEKITNNTGKDWRGFTESLVEVSNKDNKTNLVTKQDKMDFSENNAHPWLAHFHANTKDKFMASGPGNQFKLAGAFPNRKAGPLTFTGFLKGDGTDSPWTPTGIGIHERIFGDVFNEDLKIGRQFKLVETPLFVPEPSSLIAFALGAATVGYAWLRRKSTPST